MRTLALVLGTAAFLQACSGGSFKGQGKTTSVAADGTAVVTGASGSSGFNPDGSPKIGPHALTDFVKLSSGIDLIIAVDTSGSMAEETAAVQANLVKMIQTLQNSKLDPMIHLMLSQQQQGKKNQPPPAPFKLPADVDPKTIALVDQAIGSHDALSHLMQVLAGDYSERYRDSAGVKLSPAPALRAGAQIEILVVSDDNGLEEGNLAKDFDPSNTFKATFSAIIGLPNSAQAENVCQIAAVGQEYITLATKTGGSLLDICAKDWTALIDRFSQDIVKRSVSLLLSKVPADPAALIVNLDGKQLAPDAWTYNAAENRVALKAETPYSAGMTLAVNYDAKD